MNTLTKEIFDQLPKGEVFASGVLPNSSEGLFMTNDNLGKELRWVAKKSHGDDWAIYCQWADKSVQWVADNGDKVYDERNIKRCVPCDNEVFELYRF